MMKINDSIGLLTPQPGAWHQVGAQNALKAAKIWCQAPNSTCLAPSLASQFASNFKMGDLLYLEN
jgi:hypothetical protein